MPAQPEGGLATLARDAEACRRCDLWQPATQVVFGEGPADARIMMIGEQPGDQEDLAGRPFVGPAGQLLDRAMAEAGLDRSTIYVTNAVKHFKFEPRGKRRIHAKPGTGPRSPPAASGSTSSAPRSNPPSPSCSAHPPPKPSSGAP